MNEVTKLYENAGVKPYIYCSKLQLDCDARETGNCKQDCEYYSGEKLFTPFTAEKQLKILCFIVNNKHSVTFHDQFFSGDKLTLEKIQENLAWAINMIWQNLSPEEKQQVKGILE